MDNLAPGLSSVFRQWFAPLMGMGLPSAPRGVGFEMGLDQLMLSSGLPDPLPGMYDILCIPYVTFCQLLGWVGFLHLLLIRTDLNVDVDFNFYTYL